ncbi:hypothetical protein BDZ45DRAFT_811443 [Acephala macrosclerotiorum]|nr:hypothetical protein BDZ45DRAFT_811443 [Acephala macrosclerotiorum]
MDGVIIYLPKLKSKCNRFWRTKKIHLRLPLAPHIYPALLSHSTMRSLAEARAKPVAENRKRDEMRLNSIRQISKRKKWWEQRRDWRCEESSIRGRMRKGLGSQYKRTTRRGGRRRHR